MDAKATRAVHIQHGAACIALTMTATAIPLPVYRSALTSFMHSSLVCVLFQSFTQLVLCMFALCLVNGLVLCGRPCRIMSLEDEAQQAR